MNWWLPTCSSLPGLLFSASRAVTQTILAPDPSEPAGQRPYEMVWANRIEPASPTVRFDIVDHWTLTVENGAEATIQVTRAQNVWNRPVARVRYRGEGKAEPRPRILVVPPSPVPLPGDADAVELWVYGNRWSWVNPPDTPPVRIVLHLRAGTNQIQEVHVDDVRWQEWWLMHRRLPSAITGRTDPEATESRSPAGEAIGGNRSAARWVLESVEISGGWQAEWREIFLDSIRFYHEDSAQLKLAPRPRRRLTLFPGQSRGANTGPGTLPFPTREKTILPMQLAGHYRNEVTRLGTENPLSENSNPKRATITEDGEKGANNQGTVNSPFTARGDGDSAARMRGEFSFGYQGKDCRIVYTFEPSKGLGGLGAIVNDGTSFTLMDGGELRCVAGAQDQRLVGVSRRREVVTADYHDGTTLRLQIWQKSLVVDILNKSEKVTEVSFGQLTNLVEPRTIAVPYLTYGNGPRPCVLLCRTGTNYVFASLWLDWYRSNASEPYAAESVSTNSARINGGVRYRPRTDGGRNPVFERLFITVSPMFEEVLPTVPNPVGVHAKEAADRLWQETWGPDNYEQQMKRSRTLRAYGIEKLIQCNHEIAWRDGGESFTLRTRAAPKKGGDAALERYVAHQRGLGWLAGLYSNYTDYAPVNQFWSPDGVQRLPDGNWRSAWPRCWAEKPLKAVEFDAILAPQIKRKYNPNSAYTDVHTAVSPWGYNDYDVRVPGAGTFAQTFYAYGELLRNDSRVYGGPIFSEGYYHWLYAGLGDGNYALMYDGRPLAKEPLLPVFDLYQIHSRECDIGMAWTAQFCDGITDWRKPENLDRAIDRFLLHTLAYGHIGWLVEEEHGLDRTCRSYYMLQQVQARYGLKVPSRIAYWDGTELVSVSKALVRDLPRTRRQLYVEYPGGLELWLNDHPSESWSIGSPALSSAAKGKEGDGLALPPAGWAAFTRDGALFSFSGLARSRGARERLTPEDGLNRRDAKDAERGAHRVDYLRSAEYIYLDGRGHWFDVAEAGSNGALAIRPYGKNRLHLTNISAKGPFVILRPFRIRGVCRSIEAFDVEGKPLAAPPFEDTDGQTRITPVEKAVSYVLSFSQSR